MLGLQLRAYRQLGRLLHRSLRMLVMLGLAWVVLRVLLRCLQLRPPKCAVWCLLPLGACRFTHMAVLYGFQGADSDGVQLGLTEQLFDAALAELAVVAHG